MPLLGERRGLIAPGWGGSAGWAGAPESSASSAARSAAGLRDTGFDAVGAAGAVFAAGATGAGAACAGADGVDAVGGADDAGCLEVHLLHMFSAEPGGTERPHLEQPAMMGVDGQSKFGVNIWKISGKLGGPLLSYLREREREREIR